MRPRTVTVFGGTGFLGQRIVRHLCGRGFFVRIASRHPDRSRAIHGGDDDRFQSIGADVHDEESIERATIGAYAVVNAVSLYVERGRETFQSVHVECARRVAAQARLAGAERLVHVSGIGADERSGSPYIRSRGEGELAVRDEFPKPIILRPAVMFGPDDAFLTPVLQLLRRLPAYPIFGRGETRLQPAYVEDVAEAIARASERAETLPIIYECGGPRVYSYKELLLILARAAGIEPVLLPVPFSFWHSLSRVAEMLPSPPLTRSQVELMEADNIASADMPGFGDLGIPPRSVEEILPLILQKR